MDQDSPQNPQSTPVVEPSNPTNTEPISTAPQIAAIDQTCKCPDINVADWDKQKKQIDKTFYKTFSPRLFHYPFSFVIDVDRATRGAKAKGYTVPEKPMVLEKGGLFWGNVLVEANGANTGDGSVVDFKGKDLYTKVVREAKNIEADVAELKKEIGAEPAELYYWWTACPKCTGGKEAKAVIIAVLGAVPVVQATPVAPIESAAPTTTPIESTTPTTPAAPAESTTPPVEPPASMPPQTPAA